MEISKTAKHMIDHPSSIREIMSLVAEFERHPEKFPRELIYLAGGWPQDTPPKFFKDLFTKVVNQEERWKKAARYSPTKGYPEIREGVTEYEEEIWGRKVNPDNVIFGLGSTEQVGSVFLSLLDPGDEVILTSPGYLNYQRQIQLETALQTKIQAWNTIKDNSFSPSTEDLKEIITDETKLLLITTPGNPTSRVWSNETIEALNDLAEDEDFYLLIDVAYRAYHFIDEPEYLKRPPKSKEIWSCTMSKELRGPGWRVSYLILPDELVRAVETIEQGRTLAPSSPLQEVLVELLQNKKLLRKLDNFYENGSAQYQEIAEKTVELLQEIPDLHILEPEGGFYVFFDVSEYNPDDKEIWRELIDKKQVALAPGSDFNGAKGWLRLSFAPVVEEESKLWEGMERMKKFFQEKR